MGHKTCQAFAAALLFFCMLFSFAGCGKAGKEYDKAVELMESGKYSDSLEHFQNAIKENNEKAEYYIAYGMALNQTGSYKEAVKQFGMAYQDTDNQISRQNNKRLYFGQAVSYYGMNDNEKALEACGKALEYGEEPSVDINIKNFQADIHMLMGNTGKAMEIYNEIIKGDNVSADTYKARGRLHEMLGDDTQAVKDYLDAAGKDNRCYDAYFALYNVYTRTGDNEKAEEILNKVADIKAKTAEDVMQKGRMYYYKGDYKNAVAELQKAAKDGCNEALYYIGAVYMAEGDYKQAAGQFNLYIVKGAAKKAPDTYNQMAGCYIELGDFESASGCIDKGMSLGISSAGIQLLKNRVILYERMGKYKKAKKSANLYLKKFPGDKDMEKELIFIKTRIKTLQLAQNNKKKQQ
ncbi:MAG: tetratricopeptide repeat protein [Lachnospiraceae bacterium]|nr:tetratricopeptide repeat protein [Lachnospiraceae bacterium]